MKLRTRIALTNTLIAAITLTLASALIYKYVWREDPSGNFERTTQTFLTSLLGLIIVGSLLSFFLGIFFSNRALRPVQRLIGEVERATESTRIAVLNPKDEIGKIAISLNGLLIRLEASSKNQKRFTADAGHELRGPLTTMQLSIDTLRAKEDSVELEDISKEVGRLAKLCNDLLDLSRVDGQKIEVKNQSLLDILDEQMRTFSRRRAKIKIAIDPSVDQEIMCNRQLFGLALRNLLENAFQYAKTQIVVSTKLEFDGLHIIVKDDGPGVPVGEQGKIFERFYRTEGVRTIGQGGTGLGLSVVSAVMDAHHGKALSLGKSGGEFHLVLM
ncbi:MAG: HAMP domain-containing histidine kinase [Actinobacteria bacterium]|nr:HAMP domain-containing histidine kinase [Actinomycetota bacterium]